MRKDITDTPKNLLSIPIWHNLNLFEKKINLLTQSQNNIINYSIAAIGGTIALFAFKDSNGVSILTQQPFILTIISVLMSMLTWASLEAEMRIHDFGKYIDNVLSRKIQALIDQTDSGDEYIVLENEIAEMSKTSMIRTIARGTLVSGKFMISYIPAIIALIVYAITFPNWLHSVMFWLAVLPALVVPMVLLINVVFITGYYWEAPNKLIKNQLNRKRTG